MPHGSPGSVTAVLARIRAGEPTARARLFDLVYAHLRRLAAARAAGERAGRPEPTSVLHAALVRILGDTRLLDTAPNRAYLYAAVSEAIRRVLVDHVRERKALKRGGGCRPLPLDLLVDALAEERVDVADLRDALDALDRVNARASQVITLRALGGFTAAEVAGQLGVSVSTVENDTRFARAWLFRAMGGGDGDA